MASQPLLIHVTTVPGTLYRLFSGQFEYMRANGFDVGAVSSPGERIAKIERDSGIEVHVVPMKRAISPISDLVAIFRLCRLFRALQPALVHSHTPKAGLLGSVAAMLAGVPVRFYSIRGLRFLTMTGWRRKVLVLAERLACGCTHRVLCNSHSNECIAVQEKLCPKSKIAVLGHGSGNGVDVKRFQRIQEVVEAGQRVRDDLKIPSRAPVVGFVGRLARDKGLTELAGAWKIIRSEVPQAHLVIVGKPDSADPVPVSAMEQLTQDESVHLVGSQSDVVPYYAAMDVFTLPSYREGFPNVVLEAAAMELPTVTFDVPGCSDAVVEGITGRVVPRGDSHLAQSVVDLLHHGELRSRLGRQAREHVAVRYNPREIWAHLVEEYRRFLPDAPTEPRKTISPVVESGSTTVLRANL